MYGKILIRCDLEVRTGMHIGGSSAFSAIGAVDSPVVRDPYTGYPIVPGSSLKGKLRTLLARSTCQDIEHMPAFDKDDERILRLFGSSEPVRRSRLQFADAFLSNAKELSNVGVTEVKTENAISRANSVANPRQIERVIAGAKFGVSIVYDVTEPGTGRGRSFSSGQRHEAAADGLSGRPWFPRQRPCQPEKLCAGRLWRAGGSQPPEIPL